MAPVPALVLLPARAAGAAAGCPGGGPTHESGSASAAEGGATARAEAPAAAGADADATADAVAVAAGVGAAAGAAGSVVLQAVAQGCTFRTSAPLVALSSSTVLRRAGAREQPRCHERRKARESIRRWCEC